MDYIHYKTTIFTRFCILLQLVAKELNQSGESFWQSLHIDIFAKKIGIYGCQVAQNCPDEKVLRFY